MGPNAQVSCRGDMGPNAQVSCRQDLMCKHTMIEILVEMLQKPFDDDRFPAGCDMEVRTM